VKPFVLYTLARFGLFAVSAVVVWLVAGLPELTSQNVLGIILVALIISSIASIKLLAGMRERFAAVVAERAAQVSARVEASKRREDDLD
jgi:Na+/melibiose symporter-like transporter